MTKSIKQSTIRGLEPEVQKILAQGPFGVVSSLTAVVDDLLPLLSYV